MDKQLINQGSEHLVYSLSDKPGKVFKLPRLITRLELRLLGLHFQDMGQELNDAKQVVKDSQVVIPKTQIFYDPNTIYSIIQDYVEDDHSISDIRQYLVSQKLPYMIDEYDIDSTNLRSNKGVVYWLDPFKGIAARFLSHTKLLSLLTKRKLHAAIKRKLYNLRHPKLPPRS